jgi:hypothetical protein
MFAIPKAWPGAPVKLHGRREYRSDAAVQNQ